MTLPERAFGSMGVLIYGQDPMVPMKLEQTFALARPVDEVKVDSFEDYEQAYDFCKEMKNTGLVFILENCGEMTIDSVYEQFSKTSNEEACFGVILHNGMETIKGLRAAKNNPNIIGYYDVNDFLDQDKVKFMLEDVWNKFQEEYEKVIIPQALGDTYRSMAQLHSSSSEIQFQNRVCHMLMSQMNVTWKEAVVLKWYPVLHILSQHEGEMLKSNSALSSMYEKIQFVKDDKPTTLESIANLDANIAMKVGAATIFLNEIAKNKNIKSDMHDTLEKVSPRSKALLRIVKKHIDQIESLAEVFNQNTNNLLKVV